MNRVTLTATLRLEEAVIGIFGRPAGTPQGARGAVPANQVVIPPGRFSEREFRGWEMAASPAPPGRDRQRHEARERRHRLARYRSPF